MEAAEERPPYVAFEVREVEDRDASLAAGKYVTREVNYAIITPQGSKDKIERIAEEWLRDLAKQVQEGRFKQTWLGAYRSIYAEWQLTREVPETGTPIMTWPALTPSAARTILNANIRTVEDLAQANESAIMAIGMGARTWVQMAKDWVATAGKDGKLVGEFSSLRADVENLSAELAKARETIATLQADLKAKGK